MKKLFLLCSLVTAQLHAELPDSVVAPSIAVVPSTVVDLCIEVAPSTVVVPSTEVVLCIAHDESAALGEEICTRARRERDALRGEIILRRLAAHQLASAGGFLRVAPGPNGRSAHGGRLAGESRGPDVYTAGDESRRHPVFLREHVAALFAQGNDRDGIRLHLHL